MTTPLAQTFNVHPDHAQGQDGIFVTKVDLYFQRKDPTLGVTVELRLTDNGFPTASVVPFSSIHVDNSSIATSNTAATATTVTFPAPVMLKSSGEYALVVIPDGNSPEFMIWTSATGQTDVLNPSYSVRNDWGEGYLFSSTNNSTWVPIPNETLKFTLYRASFGSSGTVTLTNKADEFLRVINPSASYKVGEPAFQFNSTKITGSVAFTSTSNTVTGTSTTFLSTVPVGSWLILANSAYPIPSSHFDLAKVVAVANNTSLTLAKKPNFTASGACAIQAPVGIVSFYNANSSALYLTNSTAANNTFKFTAGSTVIGGVTLASSVITAIDDKIINSFQPLFYRTTVLGTGVSATYQQMDSSYQVRDTVPIKLNDTNYNLKYEVVVASRSNEITAGSGKSVNIPLTLSSSSSVVSPVLDLQSTSVLRYSNYINGDNTGENGPSGAAYSKSISKTVVLADGQDAEDLQVYLTGYQPTGTRIEVYVRVLNSEDPDVLTDKAWTKMLNTTDAFCDPANRNDVREFVYKIPTVPTQVFADVGVISTLNGNTTITGTNTGFTNILAVGDTVAAVDEALDTHVSHVTAIANSTSLTISDPMPFAMLGGKLYKFRDPHVAFADPQNDGVVTYFSDSGKFQTFKTYAMKIVLLSSTSYIVPRVQDIRAIALSV